MSTTYADAVAAFPRGVVIDADAADADLGVIRDSWQWGATYERLHAKIANGWIEAWGEDWGAPCPEPEEFSDYVDALLDVLNAENEGGG